MKKFKNTPNREVKTVDGKTIWDKRGVAVVGMIFCTIGDDKRILLVKRSDDSMDEPGKWCMPCGYLDWDETVEEALIREIYEETGLLISDYKPRNVDPRPLIKSKPSQNRQNVSIQWVFHFDFEDEFPKLLEKTNETSIIKWVDVNTIDEYEFAFDHYEQIKKNI